MRNRKTYGIKKPKTNVAKMTEKSLNVKKQQKITDNEDYLDENEKVFINSQPQNNPQQNLIKIKNLDEIVPSMNDVIDVDNDFKLQNQRQPINQLRHRNVTNVFQQTKQNLYNPFGVQIQNQFNRNQFPQIMNMHRIPEYQQPGYLQPMNQYSFTKLEPNKYNAYSQLMNVPVDLRNQQKLERLTNITNDLAITLNKQNEQIGEILNKLQENRSILEKIDKNVTKLMNQIKTKAKFKQNTKKTRKI